MKIHTLHIALIWIGLIASLIIGVLALTQKDTSQAVIQLPQLYTSFDMTKELERKFQSSNKELLTQSDSINVRMENLTRQLGNKATYTQEGELLLMQLNGMKTQIDQSIQNNKLQIESQIWNRLNVYLMDYVQSNPYTIILGAKGEGEILHVDPSIDITEDVTTFVNEQYHGS